MSHPYQAYRTQQSLNWTRIEMLLRIYRETESSLVASLQALTAGDRERFTASHLRTLKLLLLLSEGIDPHRDEIAANIHRLCVYLFSEVSRQTVQGLQNAQAVLTILREGFERIHDEAEALEAEGKIPKLPLITEEALARV